MSGLKKDLQVHYDHGFNDGIYHAVDFMKSVANDLSQFPDGENDGSVLDEIADVLLEDIKDVENY
jgi:hypothetical protein